MSGRNVIATLLLLSAFLAIPEAAADEGIPDTHCPPVIVSIEYDFSTWPPTTVPHLSLRPDCVF